MTYGMPEAFAIRRFLTKGKAMLNKLAARNNSAAQIDSVNMLKSDALRKYRVSFRVTKLDRHVF